MCNPIKVLCSLFGNKPTTKQSVSPPPSVLPKEFVSFYILGEDFYKFHSDIDIPDFLKWLDEVHHDWYIANKQHLSTIKHTTFEELIEKIYSSSIPVDNSSKLNELFYTWYGLKHSLFMPPHTKRMFLTSSKGHLLQVLYKVQDTEVIPIGPSTIISAVLKGIDTYKNNWIIGLTDTDSKLSLIAKRLVERIPLQATNFHLVSDRENAYSKYISILTSRQFTNFMECPFKRVTTIQNDKARLLRLNRYSIFDNFAEKANSIFMQFLNEDERAKSFHDSYLLSIWNDKQHVKNNVTYVNIAFGSRPLIISHHNKGFDTISEQGARLCFYRMENGFVSISLFPAQTDNRRPEEQSIMLHDYVDPHKLSDTKFLKLCWKRLIAYMEYTAIDGRPSWCQKRIVAKMRYNRHMVIDDKYQPTRRSIVWQNRWNFIKTVGFSGFLVAILQLGYNVVESRTSKSSTVETTIQHIDSTQTKVLESVDSIRRSVHSLLPKKEEKAKVKKQ